MTLSEVCCDRGFAGVAPPDQTHNCMRREGNDPGQIAIKVQT